MAESLKAGEVPLSKVFSSDYNYYVPSYQRPYSWTINEAGTLFDDLYDFWKSQPSDQTYFLGSIVLVKNENNPKSEVIDGQQRLTTLLILLSALFPLFASQPKAQDTLDKCLWEQGNVFLGIDSKPRLKLRERDAQFFENYILQKKFTELIKLSENSIFTDSQRMLQSNASLICANIHDNLTNLKDTAAFVTFLLMRCYLVVVTTPNEHSAFRVFSVLNNRGLSLLPSDIIKAEIIGKIDTPQQERYTQKWEDLEELLGRDSFNSMLGHIRMIFTRIKPQKTLVEEFENTVISKYSDAKKLIDNIIEPYTNAYCSASNARFEAVEHSASINDTLRWLNKIDDSDWMPGVMVAFVMYESECDFIYTFIKKMEKLAATMYLTSKTSNFRIDRHSRIIKALQTGKQQEALEFMELTSEEENELLNVLNGDVYNLPARKRTYTVSRLNSFVSDKAIQYDASVFTVEHVLPQNPDVKSAWLTNWPDQEVRTKWTHRIANLIPLTRKKNSQAQNYDFNVKKDKYFKGKYGTTSYALATQILTYDEWTPAIVRKRQIELLNIFSGYWHLHYMAKAESGSGLSHYNSTPDRTVSKKALPIDHAQVKSRSMQKIERKLMMTLQQMTESRFVNESESCAVFVCSASYSQQNKEYWYSINDENITLLSQFSRCYIAFAMGSEDQILLFQLSQVQSMLDHCLRTEENIEIGKKAHYHFSFAIDSNDSVFFKQKLPVHELIDVSTYRLEN